MHHKLNLMDDAAFNRALIRISHEIIEKTKGGFNISLIGVQRRGVPLARQIADTIRQITGSEVAVGTLDITFYRDDLSTIAEHPIINDTTIPFAVDGKTLILVDDVIKSGRTVRAAIEAIMEFGRPKTIMLAVLIDRGNRELPIAPNFVGKTVATSQSEIVCVSCLGIDGKNGADIFEL